MTADQTEVVPPPDGERTNGAGDDAAEGTVDDGGKRHSTSRNVVEWLVVIAGALIVALVIKTFLLQAFFIPSSSMEPTLKVGDRVLVNKLSYRLHDVNRADVIVFSSPPTEGQTVEGCSGQPVTIRPTSPIKEKDLIKRVIAVGGDTVEERDDKVYVNGQALDESYLPPGTATPDFSFPCIKVPDGRVFVLGDNRDNSEASNVFGPIAESSIVGRAFVLVWPLSDLGWL
jgi:signal peptidase I